MKTNRQRSKLNANPTLTFYNVAPVCAGELQRVCEVLLYSSHTDPQLKGNTAVLLGSLIEAGLQVSRGQFNTWLRQQLHNGDSGKTRVYTLRVLSTALTFELWSTN